MSLEIGKATCNPSLENSWETQRGRELASSL